MYVHEGGNVRSYDRAANGALSNRGTFVNVQVMGADGGCVDANGNRFVADYSQGMIRAFNKSGASLGNIALRGVTGASTPGAATRATPATALRGADNKTLFITGDGGLYSLRMKTAGRVYPGSTTALRAVPRASVVPQGSKEWRDARGRLLGTQAPSRPGA